MSIQTGVIKQLKEQLAREEELRIERSQMQQRHAKEIGVIEFELNTNVHPKIAALASLLG
jgi:hypothetical protein